MGNYDLARVTGTSSTLAPLMPPWAAIEWARRGVSWKQKHATS